MPAGQGPAPGLARPGPAAAPPPPSPSPRPLGRTPAPAKETARSGTPDAPDEARIALLQDARAYLERPGLREAFRQFVRTAADLAKAGLVFEVVTRPDAGGGAFRHLPRHLTITTRPEPGLGEDESTVLLMGVGFWEFLPGRFQGSERVLDATRLAMDVGSFRFVENTPSGDAEIVGHEDGRPLAQYLRIDISGEGLEKSIAVSNTALGGAFVAAYRNYLEVLAERPYRSLHPYRQLSAPATPPPPPPRNQRARIVRRAAGPLASAPALPAAGSPARARRQGGLKWAWLGVIPALGGAWLLVNLLVAPQQQTAEAPARVAETQRAAPPAPASAPPAASAAPSAAAPPSGAVPAAPLALEPVPTIDLPPPLPLPPPAAPEPPAATAPAAPAPAMGRVARVRMDANVRAAPSGSAPVVRTVQTGAEVRIAGEEYGWQHVFLPNGTELGWIYGNLLD
ncbi:SH3 domain-containing protein [Teichococcus aestuarii]|uniref:SH3b domain-containing protein n=1 Tax=Teichococcus aestuarii TaxID=568898 RepID=A0A2U1V0Q4_9PROT|nr:SH3 domain-containing protein [Pseudoroseomonas aestuarii]PWC27473.1 hypothetical protein CR165_17780 [Pseudoroseomonas aestuarii]